MRTLVMIALRSIVIVLVKRLKKEMAVLVMVFALMANALVRMAGVVPTVTLAALVTDSDAVEMVNV